MWTFYALSLSLKLISATAGFAAECVSGCAMDSVKETLEATQGACDGKFRRGWKQAHCCDQGKCEFLAPAPSWMDGAVSAAACDRHLRADQTMKLLTLIEEAGERRPGVEWAKQALSNYVREDPDSGIKRCLNPDGMSDNADDFLHLADQINPFTQADAKAYCASLNELDRKRKFFSSHPIVEAALEGVYKCRDAQRKVHSTGVPVDPGKCPPKSEREALGRCAMYTSIALEVAGCGKVRVSEARKMGPALRRSASQGGPGFDVLWEAGQSGSANLPDGKSIADFPVGTVLIFDGGPFGHAEIVGERAGKKIFVSDYVSEVPRTGTDGPVSGRGRKLIGAYWKDPSQCNGKTGGSR